MNNLFKVSIFFLVGLLSGCSSDDDNTTPDQGGTAVDLNEAKLNDFKLSEATYLDINIDQPIIEDGVETKPGRIVISVSETTDVLSLSLASVNFDESKFEISPKVGDVESFEPGTVITYTIVSKVDPDKSIKYLVSVAKAESTAVKITNFKFEQSKNGSLNTDIEAKAISEYPNDRGAIYILVPQGTDIKNLVPTIEFKGESLKYKQGTGDSADYPETDLSFDFTSSYNIQGTMNTNELVLLVENAVNRQRYRVIVDFENPIEFEQTEISTPDVTQGDTRRFSFKWTHKGNHYIEHNIKARNYVDKTSDDKGNIFEAALFPADVLQGTLIKPGEEGRVIIEVKADGTVETGNYEADIVFNPKYDLSRARINNNDLVDNTNHYEDLFDPFILNVKTTVVK